jgi:hypothetical protein
MKVLILFQRVIDRAVTKPPKVEQTMLTYLTGISLKVRLHVNGSGTYLLTQKYQCCHLGSEYKTGASRTIHVPKA